MLWRRLKGGKGGQCRRKWSRKKESGGGMKEERDGGRNRKKEKVRGERREAGDAFRSESVCCRLGKCCFSLSHALLFCFVCVVSPSFSGSVF